MELSWSTFLLEIFNFLVLVWILKRFFYAPLQAVIARRQQEIDAQLAAAEEKENHARALQETYEGRLDAWQDERQQAREDLDQEIREERERKERALADELAQQRKKSAEVEARQRREQLRQLELQALQQGGRFASRLLEQGAGPELEQRLLTLFVDALDDMSEAQRQQICERFERERGDQADEELTLQVASAFPLDAAARNAISHALQDCLGRKLQCHFVEDPALVAGLLVSLGPWEMGINVRDELRGFAHVGLETAETGG